MIVFKNDYREILVVLRIGADIRAVFGGEHCDIACDNVGIVNLGKLKRGGVGIDYFIDFRFVAIVLFPRNELAYELNVANGLIALFNRFVGSFGRVCGSFGRVGIVFGGFNGGFIGVFSGGFSGSFGGIFSFGLIGCGGFAVIGRIFGNGGSCLAVFNRLFTACYCREYHEANKNQSN